MRKRAKCKKESIEVEGQEDIHIGALSHHQCRQDTVNFATSETLNRYETLATGTAALHWLMFFDFGGITYRMLEAGEGGAWCPEEF